MRRRSSLVEIGALSTGLGAQRLVSLVALPLVVRYHGSAVGGALATIEATLVLLTITLAQGHSVYASRFVPQSDDAAIVHVWHSLLARSAVTFAIAITAIQVLVTGNRLLWSLGCLAAFLQCVNPLWVLRSLRLFRRYAIAAISTSGVLATTVILGVLHGAPEWYFLGVTASNALALLAIVGKLVPRRLVDVRLRVVAPYAVSAIAMSFYSAAGVVLVAALSGERLAADYALAVKWQMVLLAGYGVVSQFVLLRLGTPSESRIASLLALLVRIGCLVGTATAIATSLVFGVSALGSSAMILTLQVAVATAFLPATTRLAIGKGTTFLRVTLTASAVSAGIAAAAIPMFGIVGAAAGALLGEVFVVASSRSLQPGHDSVRAADVALYSLTLASILVTFAVTSS